MTARAQIPDIAGRHWAVLGMGSTGVSCARFLAARGAGVRCLDTTDAPSTRASLVADWPAIEWRTGRLVVEALDGIDAIVASPGVPLEQPPLQEAQARGVPLLGDVQLFAASTTRPVIGITGSNGKSTVTTLVWRMIEAAGLAVRAGGNLGPPALTLLDPPEPYCYVLELSSFQLELAERLGLAVACVLNLSPDHLDRHGDMASYLAAKARILDGAGAVVLNADDPAIAGLASILPAGTDVRWVGRTAEYHMAEIAGVRWLCRGNEPVIEAHALPIKGTHNEFNALAALAITDCLPVGRDAQRAALMAFDGLPHRCRRVAVHAGVEWFDDSKGTNIGATVAAIEGLLDGRQGVLIAGGQGKGADFRELRPALAGRVHTVVLLGEDAALIEQAITDMVTVRRVDDLGQAVQEAARAARPGDAVLLSPACASLDMFENYAHRGREFTQAVHALVGT